MTKEIPFKHLSKVRDLRPEDIDLEIEKIRTSIEEKNQEPDTLMVHYLQFVKQLRDQFDSQTNYTGLPRPIRKSTNDLGLTMKENDQGGNLNG